MFTGITLIAFDIGFFTLVTGTSKAKAYRNGLHQYEFQRQRLVARLERERGN